MKEIKLVEENEKGYVTHLTIAEWTGVKPSSLLSIIDKYLEDFKELGDLFFIYKSNKTGGMRSRIC